MKETTSAGGVVVSTKTGDILVVSQRHRSWSLPKGHVDLGEDVLTAAKREIYEESGIKNLVLIKPLPSYKRYKISVENGEDRSEMKTIHMFLFQTDETNLAPQDADNPEARWVSKEQVSKLLTHPKDKEFFNQVSVII